MFTESDNGGQFFISMSSKSDVSSSASIRREHVIAEGLSPVVSVCAIARGLVSWREVLIANFCTALDPIHERLLGNDIDKHSMEGLRDPRRKYRLLPGVEDCNRMSGGCLDTYGRTMDIERALRIRLFESISEAQVAVMFEML